MSEKLRNQRMRIVEFYKVLEETNHGKWYFDDDPGCADNAPIVPTGDDPKPIRRRNSRTAGGLVNLIPTCCPVTAVARKLGGKYPIEQWTRAASFLKLSQGYAREIVIASDGLLGHSSIIRNKILKATGLSVKSVKSKTVDKD